ncbi:hypothetical protein ATANTOWER_032496 [Ataeniobius toweri]|uniref:Uncharacterized protein n=1 Tax=Ataeniobius toweri TaxID=208326 RepID=A0ABU7ANF0_9TELE|nr:hypothetical protein [Ataeniobius toweri]
MHNCHFAITGPDVRILVIEVAGHRRHRPGERLSLSLCLSLPLPRGDAALQAGTADRHKPAAMANIQEG